MKDDVEDGEDKSMSGLLLALSGAFELADDRFLLLLSILIGARFKIRSEEEVFCEDADDDLLAFVHLFAVDFSSRLSELSRLAAPDEGPMAGGIPLILIDARFTIRSLLDFEDDLSAVDMLENE